MTGIGEAMRRPRASAIATDTGWSVALQIARVVSSFAIFMVFRVRLGIKPDYGLYAGAQGLVVVVGFLATTWIPKLTLQLVVRDGEELGGVARRSLTLGVLGSATTILVCALIAHFVLQSIPIKVVIGLAIAEAATNVFVEIPASLVQVGSFVRSVQIRLLASASRLIVCALTIAAPGVTLVQFAIGQCGAMLVAGAVAMVVSFRMIGQRIGFGRFDSYDVVTGLSYGSLGALSAVQDDGDKTLLVRAGFENDAAAYGSAYRVFQLLRFPISALVQSTHIRFLKHDANQKGIHFGRALRFTLPAFAYSIVATVAAVALRHPLASAMGIPNDSDIIIWLAAQLPLWTLGQFAVSGLMGIGQNWSRTAIAATTTVLNAGINLIFIPTFSWKAAAAASIAADALLAALAWRALLIGQRARNKEIDVRRRQQLHRARFRRFDEAEGSVQVARTESPRPTG